MAVTGSAIPESPICFGDCELNASAFELRRGRRRVKLERIPLQVLLLLIQEQGKVVTREAIADRIWGKGVFVDVDNGINTSIRKIRQILNDDPQKPRFVETIAGTGYRFIAPVSRVVPTQPGGAMPEPSPAAVSPSRRRTRGWYVGAAACLVPLAIVSIWLWPRYRQADPPIRSLAVMPLEDLSPGTREDYFADGMTDELITELAQIPGLRIVSRMSVMRDKGTREPLAQVARELNVDALVEGSVVRSGDRIRITAQLIDARSDKHLWAQSFEGRLGDVLSLQDSVAREITSQTRIALTPTARAELTNAKPSIPKPMMPTYGACISLIDGRASWRHRISSKQSLLSPITL
jgi:TolB-like protein/DNA-binding winged helix-turn-helix (wHTH) protein